MTFEQAVKRFADSPQCFSDYRRFAAALLILARNEPQNAKKYKAIAAVFKREANNMPLFDNSAPLRY